MPDFFSVKTVLSAKERCCPECRAPIPARTYYIRFAGVHDGNFSDGFTCVPCHTFKSLYLEALDAHDLEPEYFTGDVIDGAGEFLGCYGNPAWVGKTWSERRYWAQALLINAIGAGRGRWRRCRDLSRSVRMMRALAPHGQTGGVPLVRPPEPIENERNNHVAH